MARPTPTRLCFMISIFLVFVAAVAASPPTPRALAPRAASENQEKPCTTHSSRGKYYDLNPLSASKDYTFDTPSGRTVSINVCRSIRTETFGLKVNRPEDVGAVIRKDHGHFSMGETNTTLVVRPGLSKDKDNHDDDRLQLHLKNGSPCPNVSPTTLASTTIEFICDMRVFSAGTPRLVALYPADEDEEGACGFFIEWRTHFACPAGERGGPWGPFAIIIMTFVILLMAYLVIGTVYNRYALHLSGFDQLPRFSLESARYHAGEAGYYAEEAIVWITGALQRLFGRDDNDYMGGVGGTNPVSHQSQVRTEGNTSARGLGRPPRVDTNPVSHHMKSQMESSRQPTDNSTPTTRLDSNDTPRDPKPVTKPTPKAEEQFHLLDGADDGESEPEDENHESESVAAIRGRGMDMAAEGAVRL